MTWTGSWFLLEIRSAEGQALVKYSSTEAQAAYDAASRAVAKANRHINELNESRNTAAATPSLPQAGLEGASGQAPAQSSVLPQAAIDSQISDARDCVQMQKRNSKSSSPVECCYGIEYGRGTVVEVNRNVSKSPTGNSQVLVHIVVTITCRSRESFLSNNLANLSGRPRSHFHFQGLPR